jgi:putative PIN family toxin of toxin-antitoxin system
LIRVVVDTNVLISGLIFGGLPRELVDAALDGAFLLITSPILLDELQDKLRDKFKFSKHDLRELTADVRQCALIVTPSIFLSVIEDDPDDDRVLECALAGEADYIVSGDRHLLDLKFYRNVSIVSVRDFMDAMEAGLS